MTSWRRKCSSLLTVLFAGTCCIGQVYYKAENLTTQDGLSDNQVTCFMKDRKGFMWIGTQNGLNRYDGHAFVVYRPSSNNSISNEVINDLIEDRDGRIWVGTTEGLNCFDPKSNTWEHLYPTSRNGKKTGLPNYITWDLSLAPDGRIWIASDVFEFSAMDPRTKTFTYYDWPGFARKDPILSKMGYHSINKFVPKNDHEFWLATTGGLVSLDTRTGLFTLVGSGYQNDVTDLRYDSVAHKVFLSIESGDVYRYDEATAAFDKMTVLPTAYPSTVFRKPGVNEIWMASKHGLLSISDDRQQVYLIGHLAQLSNFLLPGGVSSVFHDNQGIDWIATRNGISKFERNIDAPNFLPLIPYSNEAGNNAMAGAYFDEQSQQYFVYAGLDRSVFIIDPTTGTITKRTTDNAGRAFTDCHLIKSDILGNLWLLTATSVYRYDRATRQFVVFQTPNSGTNVNFRDIESDDAGNHWIASFGGGLYCYNASTNRYVTHENPDMAHMLNPTSLYFDQHTRTLWIGTFSYGLFRYELANRRVTYYFETDSTPTLRGLTLVYDIAPGAKGQFWVATHSGGVYRFENNDSSRVDIRQFTMRDGLPSNNYLSVVRGLDSTIWLLSAHSISAMSTGGLPLHRFTNREVFSFSAYASDEGIPHKLFFNRSRNELVAAVGGGVLFIPTQNDSSHNRNFPVVITRVTIGGRSQIDSNYAQSEQLSIPFRSNSIEFEYAALLYSSHAAALQYQYRLEGYEPEWITTAPGHSVNFQNLSPGKYKFTVRTVSSDGIPGEETSAFEFTIVPPFYRTWWFIGILLLCAAAIIYFWTHALSQRVESQKILTYFATSLYGQNTIEDVFWDVAKNCISQLGFEDCVMYQYDEERKVLVQRAAFGPKNPNKQDILNPMEISIGSGIVGSVAETRVAEIVEDTSKDPRYIQDDLHRSSEIAVPIIVDNKIFGVIDSEHPRKGFYRHRHLRLLTRIADICSVKISKYMIEERLRLKIARDLHDEMGSTLTSINIISKVAMQQAEGQEELARQLGKIKDHSSKMMESMSDIVWAINPANDTFDKVLLRMKEFAAEILEPAGINYYFREEGSLSRIPLNLEQRKDIYMIFKEALNNAVKYSGATEMNVSVKWEQGVLRMILNDNGNGFDKKHTHSGNGIRNMLARAEQMRATLRVDSIAGAGTTIYLQMAIT